MPQKPKQNSSPTASLGTKTLKPPNHSEIEVTIFGPGYGECILVHLGGNHWLCVDSCLDADKRPAALAYLENMGIDPTEAIQLIVVTHWHDDHIRGLSEIVKACPNADISLPMAFGKEEFLAYIGAFDQSTAKMRSGVKEISKIMPLLAGRSPKKAIQDRRILTINGANLTHQRDCHVYTLSPSDKQIDLFLDDVRTLFPQQLTTQFSASAKTPNHTAVVVWIEIGDLKILLGSDLEVTAEDACGWEAIVRSNEKPSGKAEIFKIAHHGSENGHHEHVWQDMLVDSPFALLSPFIKGSVSLPKPSDIARIKQYTPNAYMSSPGKLSKSRKKRDPAVERTIKEIAGKIKQCIPAFGMVQMRKEFHQPCTAWQVDLLNDATVL